MNPNRLTGLVLILIGIAIVWISVVIPGDQPVPASIGGGAAGLGVALILFGGN